MNQPEPESHVINDFTDSTIIKPAYPNGKSIFRLFFVIIFYNIIGSIAILILLSAAKGLEWQSPLLTSFFNLLAYLFSFLFIIKYAIKKSKMQEGNSFSISFSKVPAWLFPVVIISTMAFVVGSERISHILPMPPSVEKLFEKVLSKDVLSIITITVVAPIIEELLCRGIVLRGLLKNYTPNKAILISALFFALIHLNPWQALPAFFIGLFLGWVFYKTKSVLPGIIIHATNNSIAMLFLFFPKNRQDLLIILGVPYYIALCVCAAIVFTGGCWIINRKAASIEVEL
ncbi:CPBP family intramembrane glutamic endopeptidase [Mucilaginibacter flavus]|uniref:CPBP family intramembrane glutamic endopeptidase n=1 Tax=Mucilaginibacter flavus TaxID=931504 RepID=UPI0025B57E06|nr:type II CAAX endopeptidase family protein [Mucilaginibacter flavus]MDN3583573.1 type II CAAX endopeptidase family protein [Mucilaginibacter flavus]